MKTVSLRGQFIWLRSHSSKQHSWLFAQVCWSQWSLIITAWPWEHIFPQSPVGSGLHLSIAKFKRWVASAKERESGPCSCLKVYCSVTYLLTATFLCLNSPRQLLYYLPTTSPALTGFLGINLPMWACSGHHIPVLLILQDITSGSLNGVPERPLLAGQVPALPLVNILPIQCCLYPIMGWHNMKVL